MCINTSAHNKYKQIGTSILSAVGKRMAVSVTVGYTPFSLTSTSNPTGLLSPCKYNLWGKKNFRIPPATLSKLH